MIDNIHVRRVSGKIGIMNTKGSKTKRLRFEKLEGRQLLSASAGLHAAGLQMAPTPSTVTSTNWSGYADVSATKDSVTSVSGSWTVPAVSNTVAGDAAVWVGIDGYSSKTVEQTGTLSYVSSVGGPVTNYAWYEMYPSPMKEIDRATTPKGKAATVNPGDAITASVSYVSGSTFSLTITDATANWSYTTTASACNPTADFCGVDRGSTASGGTILPLANFQPVTFTGARP